MSARSTFMEEMDHLKSILTHYQLMAGEKHLQENSTQSGHLERKLMAAFIHKIEKLIQDPADTVQGVETQTECPWTSPLDMFAFTAQNASLKEQLSQKEVQVEELQFALSSKCCEIQILKQLVGI
ncbi:uncharacterized protein LOC128203670 isoform X1 [Mya arenaria]|uniref:uncharacterized protein LOC128203670 isoform X1 n=1 Tax=Mya arenaria TaxID=6604 RepID=UPI0022E1CD9F|nr:uncharacterized protein LOC128203670 isoform X1 [Mya arenaria]